MEYAIVDIETTGGSGRKDRVTEVAIYRMNEDKVIDRFTSLINPETPIPYHITQLTGINDAMVARSPKFFEVAKRIVEITEGAVFVAHNVNFDYGFLKEEFNRLGYKFNRKRLCTVRLSRKIIPGYESYSLGKLCSNLGIEIEARHRADGDAAATVELFKILLDKKEEDFINESSWANNLPNGLTKQDIYNLPEDAGVYYFYDSTDELIYVGKSKSIYSRVLSHLSNIKSKKAIDMRDKIARIETQITGSELLALLLESSEIKKHKPFYNRAQRRTVFNFGIQHTYSIQGYIQFEIVRNKNENESFLSFSNKQEADKFLRQLADKYTLCLNYCGLGTGSDKCFQAMIKKCNGACIGEESVEDYNQRALQAIEQFKYFCDNFLIVDKGRTSEELSVVYIENSIYQGFGFIEKDLVQNKIQALIDSVKYFEENKDVKSIINGFLSRNKLKVKIIDLDTFKK